MQKERRDIKGKGDQDSWKGRWVTERERERGDRKGDGKGVRRDRKGGGGGETEYYTFICFT